MSGDTKLTLVGHLGGDVELRYTPSGAAVANFSIASTPRKYDKQTNDWKDGETLWINCSVWRQAAENVAETLTRGMRVIATGNLKARSYENREGEKRTVFEMDVEEIGPSLKNATAKVAKTERQTMSNGGESRGTPAADPWSGGGSAGGSDPWASAGAQSDVPPF